MQNYQYYGIKEEIQLINLVELEWCIKSFSPAQISCVPPRLMSMLEQDHILRLTEEQLQALTEEQLQALSYSMQALDVSHTSPEESPRAGSWTEVVVKGTEITENRKILT